MVMKYFLRTDGGAREFVLVVPLVPLRDEVRYFMAL